MIVKTERLVRVPEFAPGSLLKHLPIFNGSRDVVEPK